MMTKLELVKEAINVAMSDLCDGYIAMPCGCECCPLWGEDSVDEDGNVACRENMLRAFIKQNKEEFVEDGGNG